MLSTISFSPPFFGFDFIAFADWSVLPLRSRLKEKVDQELRVQHNETTDATCAVLALACGFAEGGRTRVADAERLRSKVYANKL